MHVDGEGGDESEAEVVAERPGVGVGAKVPSNQRPVDGGVRQHRLRTRVKVVDVDGTAVLLRVQRPERCQDTKSRCKATCFFHYKPNRVGFLVKLRKVI